jgi:hypothetical protein
MDILMMESLAHAKKHLRGAHHYDEVFSREALRQAALRARTGQLQGALRVMDYHVKTRVGEIFVKFLRELHHFGPSGGNEDRPPLYWWAKAIEIWGPGATQHGSGEFMTFCEP